MRGAELLRLLGGGKPPLRVVANRGLILGRSTFGGGGSNNYTRSESRFKFTIGNGRVSEIWLAYGNWYMSQSGAGELVSPNDITIEACIEVSSPRTAVARCAYQGSPTATIAAGTGLVLFGPVKASDLGLPWFDNTQTLWVRTGTTVATSGQQWALGAFVTSAGSSGESVRESTSASSQVFATGALTTPTGGSSPGVGQGPLAILGRWIGQGDISVCVVGDSIYNGTGDNDLSSLGTVGGGMAMRALYSVGGRTVPAIKMTMGGDQAKSFVTASSRRQLLMPYCTHMLINLGVNDGPIGANQSAATTFANLKTIWAMAKSYGIRHVAQQLITPVARTSTDSWATVANQTVDSGYTTGGAYRDPLNTSISGSVGSNGLDEIIDNDPTVADATHLDKWQANGTANYATADGLHPSAAFHANCATVIAAAAVNWA